MTSFREQFPNYPASAMPTLPEGFVDQSWRNDTCPSFIHATAGLLLWVDYPDMTRRELSGPRFTLCNLTHDNECGEVVAVAEHWISMLDEINRRIVK